MMSRSTLISPFPLASASKVPHLPLLNMKSAMSDYQDSALLPTATDRTQAHLPRKGIGKFGKENASMPKHSTSRSVLGNNLFQSGKLSTASFDIVPFLFILKDF